MSDQPISALLDKLQRVHDACDEVGWNVRREEVSEAMSFLEALDQTPFHALGKPRYIDSGYREAKQRAAQGWTWVQPSDREALLLRLADARDYEVPARERENLCSVAHGEISKLAGALQGLVDDSYSLVEQPSWIRPATGLGVYRCHQCEAVKGERIHAHAINCPVGIAEAVLRGGSRSDQK